MLLVAYMVSCLNKILIKMAAQKETKEKLFWVCQFINDCFFPPSPWQRGGRKVAAAHWWMRYQPRQKAGRCFILLYCSISYSSDYATHIFVTSSFPSVFIFFRHILSPLYPCNLCYCTACLQEASMEAWKGVVILVWQKESTSYASREILL